MKDPYSVLGVSPSATDEEISEAYRALARKYHPDNYEDSNPLKDLAEEKMKEVNLAYETITRERQGGGSTYTHTKGGSSSYNGEDAEFYFRVRGLINDRRFEDAERELSSITQANRTAEWHYLASVLLMNRGRMNDAMRELEIACNMDPSNTEYQEAKRMFNSTASGYQNPYYTAGGARNAGASAPRRSSADDACNMCSNLICLDCLCECLGGDLIRCI